MSDNLKQHYCNLKDPEAIDQEIQEVLSKSGKYNNKTEEELSVALHFLQHKLSHVEMRRYAQHKRPSAERSMRNRIISEMKKLPNYESLSKEAVDELKFRNVSLPENMEIITKDGKYGIRTKGKKGKIILECKYEKIRSEIDKYRGIDPSVQIFCGINKGQKKEYVITKNGERIYKDISFDSLLTPTHGGVVILMRKENKGSSDYSGFCVLNKNGDIILNGLVEATYLKTYKPLFTEVRYEKGNEKRFAIINKKTGQVIFDDKFIEWIATYCVTGVILYNDSTKLTFFVNPEGEKFEINPERIKEIQAGDTTVTQGAEGAVKVVQATETIYERKEGDKRIIIPDIKILDKENIRKTIISEMKKLPNYESLSKEEVDEIFRKIKSQSHCVFQIDGTYTLCKIINPDKNFPVESFQNADTYQKTAKVTVVEITQEMITDGSSIITTSQDGTTNNKGEVGDLIVTNPGEDPYIYGDFEKQSLKQRRAEFFSKYEKTNEGGIYQAKGKMKFLRVTEAMGPMVFATSWGRMGVLPRGFLVRPLDNNGNIDANIFYAIQQSSIDKGGYKKLEKA